MCRRTALALLAVTLAACGGANESETPPQRDEITPQLLKADEVAAILQHAARALPQQVAVAVTDRRGVILGVGTNFGMDRAQYELRCIQCLAFVEPDCATVNLAVQLARTGAFFSANETPLTSRSVRFLSGEHFPPGIRNTGAAALFGIENTNRGCSFDTDPSEAPAALPSDPQEAVRRRSDVPLVPRALNLAAELGPPLRCDGDSGTQARCGCTTGIATVPGGVPIFKNSSSNGGQPRMVGGVGVAVRGVVPAADPVAAFDAPNVILRRSDANPAYRAAELAARAFAGDHTGFPLVAPKGLPGICGNLPGVVRPQCCDDPKCFFGILPAASLPFEPVIFVDGIEVPEIDPNPPAGGVLTGAALSEPLIVAARDSEAAVASEWLVAPRDASAAAQPFAASEVRQIIEAGIREARRIRAAIRLPLQQRTAMVLAVADTEGVLLGVYRMPDATVFSIDVAIAKARNVKYFSSEAVAPIDRLDCSGLSACAAPFFPRSGLRSTAITNRTLSFAAQPFFPSGIDGVDDQPHFSPGPFRRVFIEDSAIPCSNAQEPANGRQNGIVFFPGSAPLYRGGVLIGGFGVSGDGVEQDDLVSLAGTTAGTGFEAPAILRADQIEVKRPGQDAVRLPYLKGNRRPEQ
jgi:uncharacterized protein GlcG (DUF336 family)